MLKLLKRPVSAETVDAAANLLHEANAANVVGYVGIYLLPGQKYIIEIVGECRNAPALMRGLVNGADDELIKLIKPEL
jgi:hypothetical protein